MFMLSQAWKQLKQKEFQRIQTNHDKGNLFSSNSIHGTQKSNTIKPNMLNVGSMKLYYENMKRTKQVYDVGSYLKLVLNKDGTKKTTSIYTMSWDLVLEKKNSKYFNEPF